MEEKPKRELSEKQKKVLEENNFKNLPRSVRCKIAANGAKKTNQIKAEKVKRENSKDWAWDKYGTELIEDIVNNGTTKDKVELVKTLFPNEKQVSDINFKNLNPDVVVETLEMRKKAEDYTKKLLDD